MESLLRKAEELGYHDEILKETEICPLSVSSLELLEMLSTISVTLRQVEILTLQLQRSRNLVSSEDLIHPEVLVARSDVLQRLNSHLSTLCTHSEKLTTHLQRPLAGDFILVNAKYQREFYEIVTDMAKCISSYTSDMNCFQWVQHFSLQDEKLNSLLDALASLLAKCQRYHQSLSLLQFNIRKLRELSDS